VDSIQLNKKKSSWCFACSFMLKRARHDQFDLPGPGPAFHLLLQHRLGFSLGSFSRL
jgi:hypothetical protein